VLEKQTQRKIKIII